MRGATQYILGQLGRYYQFQSTHPLRGATPAAFFAGANFSDFNPRTPCGVRRRRQRGHGLRPGISIHAPLAGCDLTSRRQARSSCVFQSTHPLRGATVSEPLDVVIPKFQSTHPLRGATPPAAMTFILCTISIHAPLAGCDSFCASSFHRENISIHAPLAGCDRARALLLGLRDDFNPRTPCGVRRQSDGCDERGRDFNPRTPCGVRLRPEPQKRGHGNFNPRTPCGVRLQQQENQRLRDEISIHAPLAGCDRARNL